MSRTYLLILALAACGDDSNRKIVDAPPGHQDDAQIDAPSSTSPVTVTVTDFMGPAANQHAYFQASDSTVIAEMTTDATGTASAMMPNGGYVTIVSDGQVPSLGGGLSYSINTWAGVKPGDHLVLNRGASRSTSETVTVILPSYPGHTLGSYDVYSTCGSVEGVPPAAAAAPRATLTTYSCGGAADMLIIAKDTTSQIIGSFSVLAETIADGNTIDYTAKTFTAATARTFTFTNNADALDIDVADNISTPRGPLFQPSSFAVTGNPATGSAPVPALPTGGLDVIAASQTAPNTSRQLLAWGTTGNYTVDWGAQLVPDFTADPMTFDAATHKLSWTTTGGAVTPDLVGVLTYGSNNSGAFWDWWIYAPGTTSATFPTLPTDVSDFNYTAQPSVGSLVTAKVPGGYDAIRATVTSGPHPTSATGVISGNQIFAGGGGGLRTRPHTPGWFTRR